MEQAPSASNDKQFLTLIDYRLYLHTVKAKNVLHLIPYNFKWDVIITPGRFSLEFEPYCKNTRDDCVLFRSEGLAAF